jgi:hypothetical protein
MCLSKDSLTHRKQGVKPLPAGNEVASFRSSGSLQVTGNGNRGRFTLAAAERCSGSGGIVVFTPKGGLMVYGRRGRSESFCFLICDSRTLPYCDKK